MLKLIVFDWDGTLADSVGNIIACKQFLADKYNVPKPSEDIIKQVLGLKFEKAMSLCFPDVSEDLLEKIGEEFHQLMQQDKYQAKLFPHVIEVLEVLKKRGLRLAIAIATSKDRKELEKAIEFNKLSKMFDLTCCGSEYQNKPDPTMLNHILGKFDVKPSECLMIGDTTTDVEFAMNAGVKTICVTFGAHSIEKLQTLNPVYCINDWQQLPAVIEKICNSTHF